MTLKIKIRKVSDVKTPHYAHRGDSGVDLYSTEDLILQPMERRLVGTGLCMEIPLGYEGQVRPRSGLSAKYGITLTNCVGTIDSDYRGEICCLMINLGNEPYTIEPGERIAQLIISPVVHVETEFIEKIPEETKRGSGGFGSTGK